MRSRLALLAGTALALGCAPDAVTSPDVTYGVLSPSGAGDGGTGVARKCVPSADAPCVLRGGEDALVIHALLDGIEVEASASVTPPTVSILADGAALQGPKMSALRNNPRAFVSEPFLAPARAIHALTIRVVVSPGYEVTEEAFEVEAPRVKLEEICGAEKGAGAGSECTRTLGQATFTYTAWVPGDSKATATSLIDGVAQGAPLELILRGRSGRPAISVFSLPLPDEGSQWAVEVDTEDAPLAKATLNLLDPELPLLSALGCTSTPDAGVAEVESCERGASVSLQVTAPRAAHAMEANVQVVVDGRYTRDGFSMPLDIADGSHQIGVAEVVLPETGSRVEYRAAVGPSFAKPVSIELVPKKKSP